MTSLYLRLAATSALGVAMLIGARSSAASRERTADTSAGKPTTGDSRQPSVTITLAEPSPVIGITGETDLRIDVADAPADGMPSV